MELSVTSATAYLPVQAYAQPAAGRDQGAALQDQAAAAAERQAVRGESVSVSLDAQQAQEEEARRKNPGTEVARSPGFSFEYQDKHQVMKVHNSKGFLIYQVPSKGQLALIQAEENPQQPGRQIELTA